MTTQTAPITQQNSPPKAAMWMGGWLSLMLLMAVAGRESASHLSVFQVMEIRALIGFILLQPLIIKAGGWKAMATTRFSQHLTRNVVHYAAQYSWLLAVTLIPLAQVVSIEFTMPIWTAILAYIFLGEHMNRYKIAAILLGLIGVFMIVRPATSTIETGQIVSLLAAVGFAVAVVLVKSLTRVDSPVKIIFWMLVIQAALGLVPALLVWQPVPAETWPWLVIVAFCGTFSHFCMAKAMTYADATIVVPMDFLRVPLTALVGWLIYQEVIDIWTVGGALLILTGNLLNLKRSTTPQE